MKRMRKDTPLFGVPGELGDAIGFALRKMYFIQGQQGGRRSGLTVYDALLKTPSACIVDDAWVILNDEWALKHAPTSLIEIARHRLKGDTPASLLQDSYFPPF